MERKYVVTESASGCFVVLFWAAVGVAVADGIALPLFGVGIPGLAAAVAFVVIGTAFQTPAALWAMRQRSLNQRVRGDSAGPS